jgi:HK97 gp10 family phage protein
MAKALDGVAELNRKLNLLADPKENAKVLRQSAGAAMRVVQKEARARVPQGSVAHKTYKGRLVAPGFARRSLRVVTSAKDGTATARLGVRAEAFYALQFIELGTSKIPRTPWLVPAFEAKKDDALQALSDAMRVRIEKIAKRSAA